MVATHQTASRMPGLVHNDRELLSVACGARRFDTNDEDDEEDGRLNQLNGTDP
jgi:hypothetical protein